MNFELFKEIIHKEIRNYFIEYISVNSQDLGFINEDGEEWYDEEFIPYMLDNYNEEDGKHSDRFSDAIYYSKEILNLMSKFRFKLKKELIVLQKKENYNNNDYSISKEWLDGFEDKKTRDKVLLNEYLGLYVKQNMSYTILKEMCSHLDVPSFNEELEIFR